jgi:hypothetical protein
MSILANSNGMDSVCGFVSVYIIDANIDEVACSTRSDGNCLRRNVQSNKLTTESP